MATGDSPKPPPRTRERQETRLSLPDLGDDSPLHLQPWDSGDFSDIGPLFAALEATGTFRPGSLESQYATLYFEAFAEGVIGEPERERLDLAAAALGIDADRRRELEQGWARAYQGGAFTAKSPIIEDESFVAETSSLPLARLMPRVTATAAEESPLTAPPAPLGTDPRVGELVELLEQAERRADRDTRFRIAQVLSTKSGAPAHANKTLAELGSERVAAPLRSGGEELWAALSDPNESFLLVSSIFREIAHPALLARATAYRLDGHRPRGVLENLTKTKVAPVRAFAWCAAHLGLPCPMLHVDGDAPRGLEFSPTLPPTVVVGGPMLAADPFEIAFNCARHLALHRPEFFPTLLVPDVTSLADLFHGGLLLVMSDLPIARDAAARAALTRDAIRPAVDRDALTRLPHLVRTQLMLGLPDLSAWLAAVQETSDRVGLLIAGDYPTAFRVLEREGATADRLASLERFWVSRLATVLRRDLGTSLGERAPAR